MLDLFPSVQDAFTNGDTQRTNDGYNQLHQSLDHPPEIK
jgi:hypothetical protein